MSGKKKQFVLQYMHGILTNSLNFLGTKQPFFYVLRMLQLRPFVPIYSWKLIYAPWLIFRVPFTQNYKIN
jgi:hypothetical protein